MKLEAFLQHVKERKPLNTPEIYEFMNRASDEARRITFELNGAYHSMPEVRDLFARLFGNRLIPLSGCFLRSTQTSARILPSGVVSLSMPVATSRIMAV